MKDGGGRRVAGEKVKLLMQARMMPALDESLSTRPAMEEVGEIWGWGEADFMYFPHFYPGSQRKKTTGVNVCVRRGEGSIVPSHVAAHLKVSKKTRYFFFAICTVSFSNIATFPPLPLPLFFVFIFPPKTKKKRVPK